MIIIIIIIIIIKFIINLIKLPKSKYFFIFLVTEKKGRNHFKIQFVYRTRKLALESNRSPLKIQKKTPLEKNLKNQNVGDY